MSALLSAAKPWVGRLSTYQPGKPIEEVARELGLGDPGDIIKLASNENALGPSPRAVAAMQAAASRMHIYPDGDSFYLRQALARKLGVDAGQLFLGHGSNEIIALLGHVYLDRHTSIVASQLAFVVYKLVASLYEAATIEVPMRDYTHDLDGMLEAIRPDTRLVFVANPNNPTGTWVASESIARFVAAVPRDVVVVLDEAYDEYLPEEGRSPSIGWIGRHPNLVVSRTFSKAYGLAALRIGYGVMDPSVAALLDRVRQPFNVNALAQAAAIAALADTAYVEESARMNREGMRQLEHGLAKLGVPVLRSHGNFLLARIGDAATVYQGLLREGVIVRPVAGYGLPEWLRVTIGLPSENERFLDALARVLGRDGNPA